MKKERGERGSKKKKKNDPESGPGSQLLPNPLPHCAGHWSHFPTSLPGGLGHGTKFQLPAGPQIRPPNPYRSAPLRVLIQRSRGTQGAITRATRQKDFGRVGAAHTLPSRLCRRRDFKCVTTANTGTSKHTFVSSPRTLTTTLFLLL